MLMLRANLHCVGVLGKAHPLEAKRGPQWEGMQSQERKSTTHTRKQQEPIGKTPPLTLTDADTLLGSKSNVQGAGRDREGQRAEGWGRGEHDLLLDG